MVFKVPEEESGDLGVTAPLVHQHIFFTAIERSDIITELYD
jgi:hypothetical protein